MPEYLDLTGLTQFKTKCDQRYVCQENGKALSSNDFSDADKAKLDALGGALPIATSTTLGGILAVDAEAGVAVDARTGAATVCGVPTKSGANTLTGANTFTQPLSVAAPTAADHAVTKQYLESTAITLQSAQTITAPKTFATSGPAIILKKNHNSAQYIAFHKANTRLAYIGPGSSSNDHFMIGVDGSANMLKFEAANISLSNVRLQHVAPPTAASDAANKQYVDQATAATATHAALIQDINAKLQKLTGEAIQFVGKDTAHNTAQFTADPALITAFVTAQTMTLARAMIVIDNQNISWFYNGTTWQNWGPHHILVATNTSCGIVKGSTTPGHVAIHPDGTMAVNGFTAITPIPASTINNLFD